MNSSGSRRHHTKSRNGCAQCKARHVRCSCTGPVCTNCCRRREHCSFLAAGDHQEYLQQQQLSSLIAASNGSGSSSPSSAPSPAAREQQQYAQFSWHHQEMVAPTPGGGAVEAITHFCPLLPSSSTASDATITPIRYNIPLALTFLPSTSPEEHFLMCHFIESTASTLILSPAVTSPQRWHTKVCWPTILASHPYIAHAIISLSALHLCHLGPPDTNKYYSAACKNFLRASKGFRETVTSMDDSNWLPTLIFSISTLVFHFYIPFATAQDSQPTEPRADPKHGGGGDGGSDENQVPSNNGNSNKDFDPLEVLSILRSAASLLMNIGPRLMQTGLVINDPNRFHRLYGEDHSATNIRQFDSLAILIKEALIPEREKAECLAALAHLRAWSTRINGRPRTWRDFQVWPHSVSLGFLQQVSLRSPPALAVFNRWCAIMKQGPDEWYLYPWLTRASSIQVPNVPNEMDYPR